MVHFLPGVRDPIERPETWPPTMELRRGADSIREHVGALELLANTDFRAPYHWGRGVVYVGGGVYWPGIVVGIKLLREAGCNLPVEVWYRGSCEPVNSSDIDGVPGVYLIDAERCSRGNRIMFSDGDRGGWEAKLYALSLTLFNEVLFLDADAYCVRDPAPLFDLLYTAPLVFWSDLPRMESTIVWDRVYPAGAGAVPTFQGGQFVIDLSSAWRTLALAHWICQHSDYFFASMYGDQDAWRVALAAGKGRYRCLGPADWEQPAFICRLDGAPYVVHRCQSKLFTAKPGAVGPSLPLEIRVWDLFRALCPDVFCEDVS